MSRRARVLAVLILAVAVLAAGWYAPTLWTQTERICVNADESVALLHGLGRSNRSMDSLGNYLSQHGYNVINVDYSSTDAPLEALSKQVFAQLQQGACEKPVSRLHFVTHSMGGIILRHGLQAGYADKLAAAPGRAVMLSPPNQGSEVVDHLGDWALFGWLNGPAGQQLGTDAQGWPARLGPAPIEVGIITGDRSINLLLSRLIPGPDDGKVSVERARLAGMRDFLVLQATHPFIMSSTTALEQTLAFLKNGRFDHAE